MAQTKADARQWYEKGHGFTLSGDYDEAAQAFDEAIELDPKLAEAYLGRAVCREMLGDRLHAIDDMEKAAKLGSKDAKTYLRDAGWRRGRKAGVSRGAGTRSASGRRVLRVTAVFSALILVAAATLAGATYWCGIRVEKEYRTALELMPKTAFRITPETYERGVRTSRASMMLSLPGQDPARPLSFIRLRLIHHITHGPVPPGLLGGEPGELKPLLADVRTSVEWGPEFKSLLERFDGIVPDTPFLLTRTTVYMGGEGESHLTIPVFHDKKGRVLWEGLDARATFEDFFGSFKGSANAPELRVSLDRGTFSLRSLNAELSMRKGVGDLYLGDFALDIARLRLVPSRADGPDAVSVDGFTMKQSTGAQGELVTISHVSKVKQVTVAEKRYGPGTAEVIVRNLDASSLARLKELSSHMGDGRTGRHPSPGGGAVLPALLGLLPKFLSTSPELELRRIAIDTPEGALEFNGRIGLDRGAPVADNPLMALSALEVSTECVVASTLLRSFLKSVHLHADGRAGKGGEAGRQPDPELRDARVMERIEKGLANLEARGLIVMEQGRVSFGMKYRSGTIWVNKIPLSVQEFQQAVGSIFPLSTEGEDPPPVI